MNNPPIEAMTISEIKAEKLELERADRWTDAQRSRFQALNAELKTRKPLDEQ